ncbi:MAG: S8 family serine peptidase [Bacteroidales bacterium]|nr:S8 family serine peptidase [Bacteroidales bacterium]
MKYFILIIASVISMLSSTKAQTKQWVYFTDKANVNYNPSKYLSKKTIEKRLKQGISLNQYSDWPLNQNYIEVVSLLSDSVGFQSRWFNAIVVWTDNERIAQIQNLPFVLKTELAQPMNSVLADFKTEDADTDDYQLLAEQQIELMQGQLFEPLKIDGSGIRIAIFDGGFPNVDKAPEFEHIRNAGHIIATRDFTKNKDFVYYSSTHGTMVLSNIGGIWNQHKLGLATNAEFLLAKTEVGLEPFAEEEYWLAAVEWADQQGADIINSSLGYTHHRYFRDQMDGTSLVARAANMAVSKGILVVNAAGNEGEQSFWKYIGTPADADSVLSIGGIDPETGYHISFSSYGPTADGRAKPNVSAMGKVVVVSKKGITTAYGTSFASPLAAGFAACVLQMNPNFDVHQLFDAIQKSATLYPYYDYAHGFGIPQASYFTQARHENTMATFRFKNNDNLVDVEILNHVEYIPGQRNYLYYHIKRPDGKVIDYGLVDVIEKDAWALNINNYENGDLICVHFHGYTSTFKIEK